MIATIAQHFSAGTSGEKRAKVPQGRKKCSDPGDSVVPAGLISSHVDFPALKCRAIFLRSRLFTQSDTQQAHDEHLVHGRSHAPIAMELVNFLRRGDMVIEWAGGPAHSVTAGAK